MFWRRLMWCLNCPQIIRIRLFIFICYPWLMPLIMLLGPLFYCCCSTTAHPHRVRSVPGLFCALKELDYIHDMGIRSCWVQRPIGKLIFVPLCVLVWKVGWLQQSFPANVYRDWKKWIKTMQTKKNECKTSRSIRYAILSRKHWWIIFNTKTN